MDAGCDAGSEAQAAVEQGATAILTDRLLPISVPQCIVDDPAAAHSQIIHELKGKPSTKILTVGVIGTHGKTTSALYVAAMLKRLTGKVAYWTTLGLTQHGSRTTHKDDTNANSLIGWLARAVEEECPVAVVEISDTMLQNKTAHGLEFDVVLIPSFRENQCYSKQTTQFLESATLKCCHQLKEHGVIVYNADDARLNRWIRQNELTGLGYGIQADTDVHGRLRIDSDGERQLMVSAGRSLMPMQVPTADHVARHMLGAVGVGYAFGLELNEVIVGVERLNKIPGRLQNVEDSRGVSITIDRADQADRLAVTMHALQRTGKRTIVVAEVPESSTNEQRAQFGRVLSRTASRVILTQSRASLMVGQRITWEVIDGCENPSQVEIIPNRKTAIEAALQEAQAGEQVVLVGMGTESWMPPRGKVKLTDEQVATACLAALPNETMNLAKLSLYKHSEFPNANAI
jgi:UDP-N-acetylmuramoyl-L-alanyl-D-glutamate--2,6-diaminopimelate ligase